MSRIHVAMLAMAFLLMLILSACGCVDIPIFEGTATLNGTVVDATSGSAVEGAEVCFVENGSMTDKCDTTDANGAFELQFLPSGNHAVQVSKSGYTTTRENVQLADGATTTIRIALNPTLSSGELRIVLTWGENPSDLDSHLWVPQSTGYYEVYFDDQGSCSSDPWACLDVDDTDSYGPETITISQLQGGTYSYAVHWYTGAGSWAGSDAVVRVYGANGLIAAYTVPNNANEPGGSGALWWYVFDLSGSTLTPKNTLSTNPPHTSQVSSLSAK